MSTDFRMNPSLNPASIAQLFQQRAAKQAEMDQQAEQQKANNMLATANAVSNIVSSSVEASKARQRKDMINNLSASMAALIPNKAVPTMTSTTHLPESPAGTFAGTGEGEMTGQVAPSTMVPDVNRQNAVKSAVQVNPDAFAKQFAGEMFPDASSDRQFAPQQGALEIKGGKVIPAVFKGGQYYYANTDQLIPPDQIVGKGFKPSLFSDPYTEDKALVSGAGATQKITGPAAPKPGELINDWTQLTPVRRKAIDEAKQAFDSADNVKAMTGRLQKFKETEALLDTENWVGDAALGAFVARTVASEVGNLNQQEQEIYRMSPEIIRKIKTKAHRWANGTITKEDREDIRKVVEVAKAKTLKSLDNEAEFHTNRLHSKMKNVDKKLIKSNIYEEKYRPKEEKAQTNELDALASVLKLPKKKKAN
jgi:hypothetical protein